MTQLRPHPDPRSMGEGDEVLAGFLDYIPPNSLIDSAGQKATINDDYFARYETSGVGREKDRRAAQLFNLPESFHRRAQKEFFAALSFIKQLLI